MRDGVPEDGGPPSGARLCHFPLAFCHTLSSATLTFCSASVVANFVSPVSRLTAVQNSQSPGVGLRTAPIDTSLGDAIGYGGSPTCFSRLNGLSTSLSSFVSEVPGLPS